MVFNNRALHVLVGLGRVLAMTPSASKAASYTGQTQVHCAPMRIHVLILLLVLVTRDDRTASQLLALHYPPLPANHYGRGAKMGNAPSVCVIWIGLACGSRNDRTKIRRTHPRLSPFAPARHGASTEQQ